MKFTAVLPSLLSDYPGAATERPAKLIRAIRSVLNQTFTDFELIVVADGCAMTEYVVKKIFPEELQSGKVRLFTVERKGLFGNAPRNKGITEAKGEYITYIDNDDKWGPGHLQNLADNIDDADWVYSNDNAWNGQGWVERTTDVTQYGRCGTSNICHAAKLGLTWDKEGYGHDYHFIQQLCGFLNYKQVPRGEYYVCHFNGGYQV
jgi:hypothetical protein